MSVSSSLDWDLNLVSAINRVIDPCSEAAGTPAGLVDMGLLIDLQVREQSGRRHIQVVLALTEPSCLMGHAFVPSVRRELESMFDQPVVDVRIEHSAIWDESRMDPAYRKKLQAGRRSLATSASNVFFNRKST